ncbi:MAG: FGGY-family carbohydrate kinase [Synergistales bacterium]|nr:FGGY-family carbohydrate kinase [Synergistales bacterium]
MAGSYILVHDMGTTGDKAVLFDESLNMVASEYIDFTTYYPHLNWSTQRISEVYETVVASTRRLMETSKVDPGEIAVISFSNQMMTMIPVDRHGEVLMDEVGIWCDMRQKEQADRLMDTLGGNDEYYRITGVGWQPELAPICKVMWYKDNVPEIYQRTYAFLQYKELIAERLTGEVATEYGDMSMNGMMDSRKRAISPEIFQAAGVDQGKIPEILNSHDIVGRVTAEAAEEFGLAEGTPVTLGSGDVICANTGAGVIREGMGYTYIGSANWSAVYADEPSLDPRYKMNCNTMQPFGGYNLVMITASGGIAQDWFRDGVYGTDRRLMEQVLGLPVYTTMHQDARAVPPGAEGLLFFPYLRGGGAPHFDINARGCFLGLGMTHTRAHMLRAIYEGVCFNMRWLYDLYEEMGVSISGLDRIRAIGGGVRNDLWMQIYADVNGQPFSRLSAPQQSTALGAAIMGGVGVGIWKDYAEATGKISVETTFHPDSGANAVYEDLYRIYREAYPGVAAAFPKLTGFAEKHLS